MRILSFLSMLIMAGIALSCGDGTTPVYKNPKYSFEKRVDDLVSQMTLEEKVSQLSHFAEAIKHLGIPKYNWWNECLHGVARAGKATVFPQSIGMAATFDRDMVFRMADITSTEARAKYNNYVNNDKREMYQGLTFWSPNINIFRDPRWGRGHETYGEDPFLTGELAVQFIKGLQGDDPRYLKVVATAKHYAVHSGPEPLRHEFDAITSDRDFRDTYLPAFKKSVEEGGVWSIMCAYNRYMGEPCCGNNTLQNEILRNELGFKGYIVSDCGAIRDFYKGHKTVDSWEEAAAVGVQMGTDLNCGYVYPNLVSAVEKGLINEEDINVVVKRLMLARMKLGMFDPDNMVPWSGYNVDTVANPLHKKTSLEMARKSIVLLKNEDHALPLSKELQKVAVIGPNAHNHEILNGNYNGTPVDPVSIFEGIGEKLGDSAEVRYALGSPHHSNLPYLVPIPGSVLYADPELSQQGLRGAYFNNLKLEGEASKVQVDPTVDFLWFDDSPPEGLINDNFSVSWTGFLVPEKSGDYNIGVYGKYFEFILDGDTLIRYHNIHDPDKQYRLVSLEAGKPYQIQINLYDKHVDASCRLHWEVPNRRLMWEAMQLAAWADQIVLVMGLSARLEGEEMRGMQLEGFEKGDRTSLDLPDIQKQLIRRISYSGKPVTLVLLSGSAISLNWEQEHLPAIIEAWYPGEQAGHAVADVLFGDHNPAGRLPLTFYKAVDDLPSFDDYDMDDRTYRYFSGEVLYPFGYGLSYTSFTYENLILDGDVLAEDEILTVSVDITNTGSMDGEEVVQLYIQYPETALTKALKDLRGFERILIKEGQTRNVTFDLTKKDLAFFDSNAGEYITTPGTYKVLVGPSSDDEGMVTANFMVKQDSE